MANAGAPRRWNLSTVPHQVAWFDDSAGAGPDERPDRDEVLPLDVWQRRGWASGAPDAEGGGVDREAKDLLSGHVLRARVHQSLLVELNPDRGACVERQLAAGRVGKGQEPGR